MLDLKAERVAPHGQAMMLSGLSRVAVARGDQDAAKNYSKQAVELALSTEDMPLASGIVAAVADVDQLTGGDEIAARILGLASAMRGMRTVPDRDIRGSVERLREALGEERYEAAYGAGAALARDDAVAELRKRLDLPDPIVAGLHQPGGSIRSGPGPAGVLRTGARKKS